MIVLYKIELLLTLNLTVQMDSIIQIGIIPIYFSSITESVYRDTDKIPEYHEDTVHLQDVRLLLNKNHQCITVLKPDTTKEFKYKGFIKDHLEKKFNISRKEINRCKLINDKFNVHLYLVWLNHPKKIVLEDYRWRKFLLTYSLTKEKYETIFQIENTLHISIFQELLESNNYLDEYCFALEKENPNFTTITLRYILEYIYKMLFKLKK